MKKVSVIIPTYNRAELVQRAVQSVLSQTYQNFEILVVDDGSTDNTAELFAGMEGVRYLKIDHSGLPARSRNFGIGAATGDYIAFLDDDDLWMPEKLEKQVQVLENRSKVALVCSNAFKVTGQTETNELYFKGFSDRCADLLESLLKRNFVICSSVMFRKSILQKTGLFSEDQIVRGKEDYDLWLRQAIVGEVCFLAEPLVIYRDQPTQSIRAEEPRSIYWLGMMKILENIRTFFASGEVVRPFPTTLMKRLDFTYRRKYAREKWREGYRRESLRSVTKLAGKFPLQSAKWIFQKAGSLFTDNISPLESEEQL
jgi:teichuronic acid biosynthesis glycosyltransferase TuaG